MYGCKCISDFPDIMHAVAIDAGGNPVITDREPLPVNARSILCKLIHTLLGFELMNEGRVAMTAGTHLRYFGALDPAHKSAPRAHGSVHLIARRIPTVAVRAREPIFLVNVTLEELSRATELAFKSGVAHYAAIRLRYRGRCLCLRC
jgi:hypothetical protein